MERQKFEALVFKAIEALPAEFKEKLDNVDVVVEDFPSAGLVSKLRLKYSAQLLGLYEGVPRIKRGTNYTFVLPDKITIFQKPIESKCSSEKQVEIEIGDVIRHEIAHHFGIDDKSLRQIEIDKRRPKR